MGWETHPAQAMFPRFAEDWDRLNARLYAAHPFFDSRFVGPLLEYFANGREQLCIHRCNGGVSGALILQPAGSGRWSSFRPSQTQATAVLLSDAALLEDLLKTLPGFAWSIELLAIDPRYSPDFSQLERAKIMSAHAHTIGIEPDISFSDYWENRPRNLKANVRRYFNRSEKEFGTPELVSFSDRSEMSRGVARFGELETAGWKGAAGTAVSIDNRQGKFYSEVLGRFAQSKQAAVYELRVGDQLAASRLVISSEQMFVILKTTYDESLARFAPGRILLYQVVRKELESHSGKCIEFYTNATRDQKEWATFGCTIQNVQVFRNDFFAATFTLLKLARRSWRGEASRRSRPESSFLTPTVMAGQSAEELATGQSEPGRLARSDDLETSLDWFELLRKTVYPADPGVRYYFVDEGTASTVLPVRLTRNGVVRTVESLSNYYSPLYAPLVSGEGDLLSLNQMIATATRDHRGAHVMRFVPMDPASPAYAALLSALRACDWIPFPFFCFGNWFHRIEDDWEGYLKKRSRNLRLAIKRRSRQFIAAGGTIEIARTPERVEAAILAFQEIYSASWKRPEPYPQFVPSLIRHLASRGMLRLGIARLGERAIAAQLWIVAQNKASIYKVAYHRDFASYSPGTVLTAHLFEQAIECDRVAEVDFLIGDDIYKKIWMSNRRERWGIVAYNPRTIVGLALLTKEVLGRIVKSAARKVKNAFLNIRPHEAPVRATRQAAKCDGA